MKFTPVLLPLAGVLLVFACGRAPEATSAEVPAGSAPDAVAVDSAMAAPMPSEQEITDVSYTVEDEVSYGAESARPKSAPKMPSAQDLESVSAQDDDLFHKAGQAGLLVSRRDVAKSCLTAAQSSFSATLKPRSETDLVSFVVFADNCGAMEVRISGPDLSETTRVTISKGRNTIRLENLDLRLNAGATYTLTCTGLTGCGASTPPKFENAGKCPDLSSANHPNLVIDQKKAPHVYDLKFLYQ